MFVANDNGPLPHPIPYQGSKRNLASRILALAHGRQIHRFYEPFAGSAAITIAAASAKVAERFIIGDTLEPLISVWQTVLRDPVSLARAYTRIWSAQSLGDHRYYTEVREAFNKSGGSARLLYLLARCVKNSPRWNRVGGFNQSADKRRLGMRPEKMCREIEGAHRLLRGKTEALAQEFECTIADAGPDDFIYLDPPWEGTSGVRDPRYYRGLERDRLITALDDLNRRRVPWLLSYDGRCGAKTYGSPLPVELLATRLELQAGRSSQATLNGVKALTIESLYVSQGIQLGAHPAQEQISLWNHAESHA